MDLAKDLAWQKIFRGRSTNLKIEKSGFFVIAFSLLSPPISSHFLIPSKRVKLQPKILMLRGHSTDTKNLFFFLRFFLPLVSSLTRKFRSFWSDNKLRERSNEQWTRSSLSDQKERHFRVRLEIKSKKKLEKKTIFFYLLSDLLILVFSVVIFYAHWVSSNEKKMGGESIENAKKTRFFNFQIRWATSKYFFPGREVHYFTKRNKTFGWD